MRYASLIRVKSAMCALIYKIKNIKKKIKKMLIKKIKT